MYTRPPRTILVLLLVLGLGFGLVIGAFVWSSTPPTTGPASLPPTPPLSPQQPPPPTPASTASPDSTDDLSAALEGFLGAVPVQPVTPTRELLAAALRDARADGSPAAPLDYRARLEQLLRERPDGARLAAQALLAGEDVPDVLLFQHAQVLSAHLNDGATDTLLEGLDGAGPHARPHAVFALRGRRTDPRVQEALLARYTDDAVPAVRAQAGFVLGEGGEQIDPALLERARQVARKDLRASDPHLIASAADVLGVPPLAESDRRLLTDTVERDPDPARREAALRALASAGTSPAEMLPLLQRVADDPRSSEALRQAARRALEQAGER